MQDFTSLSSQELQQPEALKKIGKAVEQAIDYYEEDYAFELSRQLRNILQRQGLVSNPEILKQLQRLAVLVDYICLPAQAEQRVFDMFQNHMKDLLVL
ncbi:MAG: hypothetical protein ACFFCW_49415, partial [Candidatus Hodarchaeota archaeon]